MGSRDSPWSVLRSRDKEPGGRHRRRAEKGQRVPAPPGHTHNVTRGGNTSAESGELPSPVAVRASRAWIDSEAATVRNELGAKLVQLPPPAARHPTDHLERHIDRDLAAGTDSTLRLLDEDPALEGLLQLSNLACNRTSSCLGSTDRHSTHRNAGRCPASSTSVPTPGLSGQEGHGVKEDARPTA